MTKATNIYKQYYYKVAAVFNGQTGPLSNVQSAMYNPITYRALTIGEGNYVTNPLQATIRDSIQMKNALLSFKSGNTRYSTIQQYSDKTEDQIYGLISSVFAGADANDVSLFYFSGHGAYDNDTGTAYLVDINHYGISSWELRYALDQVPGVKYVFLDTCHSGGFIAKDIKSKDTSFSPEQFVNAFTSSFAGGRVLNSEGYFVIAASRSDQYSWEVTINGTRAGLFTYYLLESMGWSYAGNSAYSTILGDSNRDKKLTFAEAYNYTSAKVLNYTSGSSVQSVQVYPYGSSRLLYSR